MKIKKSEDYGFLRKYIKNESDKFKKIPLVFKEKNSHVEVFGRIGEGESYPEKINSHDEDFESSNEKIESKSNSVSDAKRKFLNEIEDDSLTIDTCRKVNSH